MKLSFRILALALASLMLLACFVSCGRDDGNKDGDSAATTTVSTDGSSEKEIAKLPDMNWDGAEYQVIGRDGGVHVQFYNNEIACEELTGEVVDDAVYTRNQMLKEKYGLVVKATLDSDVFNEVNALYNTNEDVYDLVIYIPLYAQRHAQAGFLSDLHATEYINLEHPSWNDYANEQLTVMGKLYYTTSDFLIQDKSRTYILLYNRELFRSYEEYAGMYIEDWVEDNQWTLEKAGQLIREFTYEVDGLTGHSDGDAFGLTAESYHSFSTFLYGAGFRTSTMQDGVPVLVGATDRIISIIDLAIANVSSRDTAMYANDYSTNPTDVWCNERSLIFCSFPSVFESSLNKKCNFEFGILPFPKYDTAQDKYYTHINIGNGSFFAIPNIAGDQAFSGFGLEALTEYSTDTSLEAFYETKCKLQDVYDQRCADMLDLVFENVVYDIAAICDYGSLYSYTCEGGTSVMAYRQNVYKRLHDKSAEAAQQKLDELIAAYTG